jgi:hypothetical protein
MDVQNAIRQVRENARQFGASAALHDLQLRAANRIVPFQVLRGMTAVVADIDPRMFESPGYQARFASRAELLAATAGAEVAAEMSADFVDEALARGDQCFALFDDRDGTMASFGWYSSQPTPIASDLRLRFDPAWVYMYKGYTLRSHRGKRLHGIGMSGACRAVTGEHGVRGLISYVKSTNFQSLRSVARMGYRIFGDLYIVRALGRPISWATPGCRPYGFCLEPAPPARS